MSPIHLRRIDPSRNMARFYDLSVQPDLFGAWSLCLEWGRVGQAGTVRRFHFDTPDEAGRALEHKRRAKIRRGYTPA